MLMVLAGDKMTKILAKAYRSELFGTAFLTTLSAKANKANRLKLYAEANLLKLLAHVNMLKLLAKANRL
ncbi:hypothetical protein M0802_011456 [Mischocyttarus mexicanus]|nr:hypothetical protein M0802_011456 [Mischocyttarus mexicanus]